MARGVDFRGCATHCPFLAVGLRQCWHTNALVFVVYGELLAACFSRAGLHCVETLQLLLLLLLLLPSHPHPLSSPLLSSPLLSSPLALTSPALACKTHGRNLPDIVGGTFGPRLLHLTVPPTGHLDVFSLLSALKHILPVISSTR